MSATLEPGIGQQLAAARQAKGLSTAEVAEKLKLTARQIEALEAEEFERLPAAVFVRGFVRNYARLVGLAPEALVPSLDGAQAATETITAPSEGVTISGSPIKRWMIYLATGFALFLVLVALLYNWLSQGEKTLLVEDPAVNATQNAPAPATPEPAPALEPPAQPPAPPSPPAAAPAANTPVGATGSVVPPVTPPAAPAPIKPVLPPAPPTAIPPTKPAQSAATQPVSAPGAPTAAQANPAGQTTGGGVIRMTAREDSWVEAIDATGKRMQQHLPGGATASLRGTPPFRVTIGNAAGVQLRYNEQLIDLQPFTGDRVARLTLE